MTEFDNIKPKGFEILKNNFKKQLKEVKINKKQNLNTELNFIDKIRAKLYVTKIEGEKKMFDAIKKFIVEKIFQWIMKIGGTWILAAGVSENSVYEIIAGIVSILISMIWSLLQTGKIALTDPKEFTKFK